MPVLILRGLPYSGKTTFASQLEVPDLAEKVVCSADDYFRTSDGRYEHRPERIADAHAWCFREFLRASRTQAPRSLIVVDNTNIRLWEASPYVAVANAYGLKTRVITFECPTTEIERRHKLRTGQVVPLDAIERMRAAFEPSLPFWHSEVVRWTTPSSSM